MPYADPEKKRAKDAVYKAANKARLVEQTKAWIAANPERHKANKRRAQRRSRGVENASGEAREGPCDICLRAGPLVLDHNHDTGRVRGWLCVACNVKLRALDDRLWFDLAEAYRVKNQ